MVKAEKEFDIDCNKILTDLNYKTKRKDNRGEFKIEMIHSDDDSNHSSSSDSSRSSKDSEKSSERYHNTSSIRSLVQTCNYKGLNIKNKRRERTYYPRDTGFYAITVNLIIYEEDYDRNRLLFQRRKHHEIIFPSSEYILSKETPEQALCRIVKKELDVNINENDVRNMYLLTWLPNDDNKSKIY